MKSKKVVVVLHQSNLSGAPRVLLDYFENVKLKGYTFRFFINNPGPLASSFKRYGSLSYFPADKNILFRKILKRFPTIYEFLKGQWFRSRLYFNKPDLVYLNTISENPIARQALKGSYNTAVHIHEMNFSFSLNQSRSWKQQILTRPSFFVACSNAVSSYYQDCFGVDPQKIATIYGTVNYSRFESATDLEARYDFNLQDDVVVIGALATPHFLKGTDILVKAAAEVVKNYKNSFFIWQGGSKAAYENDPFIMSMKKMIEKLDLTAHFILIPESNSVSTFYNSIDIFATPSREDCFPLSVLEAMYFKVPVVGFDICGIPEAVGKDSGILSDVLDHQSFATILQKLIANKTLRDELGANGSKKIKNKFSSEIVAKDWKNLLDKIS